MPSSNTEFPVKSMKVKKQQGGKFSTSSRHLTREPSMARANSSFEVYYGGTSASVPFTWESQPGTPKNRSHETRPLPPLTPPPSFHFSPLIDPAKKQSKSKLLHAVLPKLSLMRKPKLPPPSAALPVESPLCSSSSSPRSSSHSFSVPSSPYGSSNLRENLRFSSPRSSFDSRMGAEDVEHKRSPVSTLCFGFGRRTDSRLRNCSPRTLKVLFEESA